jgi:hypothetical protein
MPSYEYYLIEKTILHVTVDANHRDEADDKVEEIMDGDLDWGMGDMEVTYEFAGEVNS